jgi:hypothetical protein
MAGRPKKGSNPKKVELNAEQKRYSAIVKEVAELTALKQKRIDALSEKIETLEEEQETLQNEVNNLMGIKTSAENILASKPAPPEWEKFVKHVYEYHYHYYPNTPYYIYPWWTYTIGGTLQYPTWQTITTPCYGGSYSMNINTTGGYSNAFVTGTLGNAQSGTCTVTTNASNLPTVTNAVNCNNVSLASSSFNSGLILSSNGSSVPTWTDASAGSGSTVFCSGIVDPAVSAPAMTGYMMNVNTTTGAAYTPTDEQVAESEKFLNSIGFTN